MSKEITLSGRLREVGHAVGEVTSDLLQKRRLPDFEVMAGVLSLVPELHRRRHLVASANELSMMVDGVFDARWDRKTIKEQALNQENWKDAWGVAKHRLSQNSYWHEVGSAWKMFSTALGKSELGEAEQTRIHENIHGFMDRLFTIETGVMLIPPKDLTFHIAKSYQEKIMIEWAKFYMSMAEGG